MRKVIAVTCTIQVTQTPVSLRCGITTQKVKIKAIVVKKKEARKTFAVYCCIIVQHSNKILMRTAARSLTLVTLVA